ncbi:beta-ketoacyl-ACP reductase [Oceanidesulfovibrio indonesiensis]|uniref:3-oxoacyl-[acyl-carrier-protein] reductase n=1 Tax=Oceanidesulfovibrio indonesiensis TaxID=54767 RepID=A0A7M3MB73_9BACT|nr:3-oxoacyl-[acyl-carrier-protein] reductase [Oceanidesulfovibrio indonesiensis]TVM15353.1 beta-ketoacyl-ACP reductase [Oceanidesulfovibrio indonesiensis]
MSELPKTALVTGGSRGIGRSIAKRLAREGLQVYLTYVSKPELAEETVADIVKAGGRAAAFQLDVADPEAIRNFFASEVKDKIHLSVLVNNAGMTKDGLILRMKEEDFDRVLNVNLKGAFVCLQEAAKIMSRQRVGRIVNISSVVAQMGNAGQANYVSSKSGLIGLTKTAAQELASRNVTVNAVTPGFIESDMTDVLPEKVREAYLERIPMKRLGSAEDIAGAVAFLVSEDSGYITGQVLSVNGGMYM